MTRHLYAARDLSEQRARATPLQEVVKLASNHVKVLSADNSDARLLRIDRPVVVDFWAGWCGPCRALAPKMEELARELDGRAGVVKVDVDEHPELAKRFRVASIPCLIVFRGGQEVRRIIGAVPKARIAEAIEEAIPE